MRSEALGGGAAKSGRHPRATLRTVKDDDHFSLEDSRLVRSVWIWRAFFVLSLVAVGVAIIFFGNGKTVPAILWLVIAAGWFAFAMGLWRKHSDLGR